MRNWVLAATILGSSLVFIDGTVVSIALPVLQSGFHASATDAQWVIEGYTLALGALMLLAGALADRYGRKKIFIIGTVVFAIGSLACGLAMSMPMLIASRVLQGIGGTMLAPASLALIGASFTGEERGKAVGTWSSLTAVATTIGPVAGGVLIDHFGWRSVFFINLPLAAIVIALSVRCIQESRDDRNTGPLDIFGSFLVTFGLGAIVYAFIVSGLEGWNLRTIGAIVIGIAALVTFVWAERRERNPIVPLDLFARRSFSGINLMTFFLYGALGGLFYFLPFVLIRVDGYTATIAGIATLPLIFCIVVLSRYAGGLVYRFGARTMLIFGPSIVALGFAAFTFLPSLRYWQGIFPAIMLVGIGMGFTVAPLTTSMVESVPEHNVGVASGINNAVSRIAGLLAIAILGAILASVFNARLDARLSTAQVTAQHRATIEGQRAQMAGAQLSDPADREMLFSAYADGFRAVALVCAVLAAASALTSAATLGTLAADEASASSTG